VGELLSPCYSVMLPLNFDAPELGELAVLDFLSMPHTLDADADVWGERRLQSYILEGKLPLISTA